MKVGDLVRHKKRGKLGIVLACYTKKYSNTTRSLAKVHWLDASKPRYIREDRMEVIDENR